MKTTCLEPSNDAPSHSEARRLPDLIPYRSSYRPSPNCSHIGFSMLLEHGKSFPHQGLQLSSALHLELSLSQMATQIAPASPTQALYSNVSSSAEACPVPTLLTPTCDLPQHPPFFLPFFIPLHHTHHNHQILLIYLVCCLSAPTKTSVP